MAASNQPARLHEPIQCGWCPYQAGRCSTLLNRPVQRPSSVVSVVCVICLSPVSMTTYNHSRGLVSTTICVCGWENNQCVSWLEPAAGVNDAGRTPEEGTPNKVNSDLKEMIALACLGWCRRPGLPAAPGRAEPRLVPHPHRQSILPMQITGEGGGLRCSSSPALIVTMIVPTATIHPMPAKPASKINTRLRRATPSSPRSMLPANNAGPASSRSSSCR